SLSFLHIFLQQFIKGGCDGHSKEHTYDASQTSAYGNSSQDPDAWKSYRRTYHSGVDQISFKLLEDDDKHQKAYGMERVHGKDHKCAYGGSQISPYYRQQGSSSDESPYHGGVRKTEEQHSDGTQRTQNDSFRTLAYNKFCKGCMGCFQYKS